MRFIRPQKATYWGSPEPDGYGGSTFADPVVIDVRWEDVTELFRDPEGRERQSSAVVYPAPDFAADVGGYLLLGESDKADPLEVQGARMIQQVENIPSINGRKNVRRIML